MEPRKEVIGVQSFQDNGSNVNKNSLTFLPKGKANKQIQNTREQQNEQIKLYKTHAFSIIEDSDIQLQVS